MIQLYRGRKQAGAASPWYRTLSADGRGGGKTMRKSCRYCGRTHDTSETCPLAPPKWERRNKNTQASKFRSTNAWTQKAERIKERDHYLCRVCMAEGKINGKDLSVHHIVPLASDFSRRLDESNLITLCEKHHRMAERGNIDKSELFELAKARMF